MDNTPRNFFDSPSVRALYAHPDYDLLSEETGEDMWNEIISFHLNRLRRQRRITQRQIAEKLRISQPAVCQRLKRPATVAKLHEMISAMGGTLSVTAHFGDDTVDLLGLGSPEPE